MKVYLLGWTSFDAVKAHALTGWKTDAGGGAALAEFAGRACYQSWSKPNPETATNAGYLRHIIEQGHLSVLEHVNVTFYFTEVSRSFTHELIRHRHFSYSELSQRFVDVENAAWVLPPALEDQLSPETQEQDLLELGRAGFAAKTAYKRLMEKLLTRGKTRKQAREAARAVMPNMTETRIVVTGNIRAWRHFISVRATEHADAEMRAVAVEVAWQLKAVLLNLFPDMHLQAREEGDVIYFGEPRN